MEAKEGQGSESEDALWGGPLRGMEARGEEQGKKSARQLYKLWQRGIAMRRCLVRCLINNCVFFHHFINHNSSYQQSNNAPQCNQTPNQ